MTGHVISRKKIILFLKFPIFLGQTTKIEMVSIELKPLTTVFM